MFSSFDNVDFDRVEASLQCVRKPSFVKKIQNGHNFGKKYRRGNRYAKETEVERQMRVLKEQRKKLKANRDSWRRSEMPDKQNEKMEDIYYANFLGDKYGDNGSHYNNKLPINLKFCDSMVEIEDDAEYQRSEEENYRKIDAYLLAKEQERQAEKEKEREEWFAEEQNFEEMYEYLLEKKSEEEEYFREHHIYLVMKNGYTREVAEVLVDYHHSLKVGGWCDEVLCPNGWWR